MSTSTKGALAIEGIMEALRLGHERTKAQGYPVLVSYAQPLTWMHSPVTTFASVGTALGPRSFWGQPGEGFWLVGFGEALSISLDGPDTFRRTNQALRSTLKDAVIAGPSLPGVGPVFLGGFRFDALSPRDAAWAEFPDALFVLPRLLFTWDGRQTWLTLNLMIEASSSLQDTAQQLAEAVEALNSPASVLDSQPASVVASETTAEQWGRALDNALNAIRAGELAKVVLARKRELRANAPFSLDLALSRLLEGHSGCAAFAVDRGSSAFLGATPEPLARLDKGKVALTCLAGSVGRGATEKEDHRLRAQLLASAKDRREHTSVVQAVSTALRGVCSEVHRDPVPKILRLKSVQHLATAFQGRVQKGKGLLDLAAALHPTPAVGGVPVQAALSAIRAAEGDRGWYAAPVGWIDQHGEGELYIGLRSALISGSKATLYAGAGIVEGSVPEEEWRETEMKFQPMMKALG